MGQPSSQKSGIEPNLLADAAAGKKVIGLVVPQPLGGVAKQTAGRRGIGKGTSPKRFNGFGQHGEHERAFRFADVFWCMCLVKACLGQNIGLDPFSGVKLQATISLGVSRALLQRDDFAG
jgi:hypothetical protein